MSPTPAPITTLCTPDITDLHVGGPLDLAAVPACAREFIPTSRPEARAARAVLPMAFAVEGDWQTAGVLVRPLAKRTVRIQTEAPPTVTAAATAQARRILSLDTDARGFTAIGRADPVVGQLQSWFRGVRPVLFHSPYEAACWAVIGNRIGSRQATSIMRNMAEEHGRRIVVGDTVLSSFPAPAELHARSGSLRLPERKIARLRAVAEIAHDGELTASALRAMEPEAGMRFLRRLPGIGPFSAELVLVRGAGHPDVFPRGELGVLEEMALAYGADPDDVSSLERIAEAWHPFRSWVALLFRLSREQRAPGERAGPRASRSEARGSRGPQEALW
ncbi:DNA-3-methyladenine glycosylase II [Amycolatopsis marina]|uniref:DNA-3-methyladenine glycosylase II n=1 Tax=Amycolatopsis marina TaxID=490629 RepID=A0A1I0YVK4_9PSEU|nr:DNA-3-methyladenine glycosylase [Amycolatopsis marina]SFB16846.1 DNA-3-methyladenine glycosylase II [Amycolatopsis marina]